MGKRLSKPQSSIRQSITYGRNGEDTNITSSRRKEKLDFRVAASEMEKKPKPACVHAGVTNCTSYCGRLKGTWFWESRPERVKARHLRTNTGNRIKLPRDTRNLVEVGGPPPRLNTTCATVAHSTVKEGERTPGGSEREPETLCLQAVEHLYTMDRVLFVEQSRQLRWLARLRTTKSGAGEKPSLNRAEIVSQSRPETG